MATIIERDGDGGGGGAVAVVIALLAALIIGFIAFNGVPVPQGDKAPDTKVNITTPAPAPAPAPTTP